MKEIIERIAVENDVYFSYGNKANQNLLRSDLIEGRVYLLLDPVREDRSEFFTQYGGAGQISYSGNFLVVQKSDYDLTYYNQTEEERFRNGTLSLNGGFMVQNYCKDFDIVLGKYEKYIKPIKEGFVLTLESAIRCSDYEVNSWEVIEVIDELDVNADGVLITFNVSKL